MGKRRGRIRPIAVTALSSALLVAVSVVPSADAATTKTTTIKIIGVTSATEGLLTVAQQHGYFAKYHLAVKWTNAVSGPAVVTAVAAGKYDLGYTADTPPLSAFANGAPLHYVVGQDAVGKPGSNFLLFVKKGSSITDFKKLANKPVSVESNAPESMLSLAVLAAALKANPRAKPSNITIVPGASLSLTGQDISKGQVGAGVAFFPYAADMERQSSLVNLGDPLAYAFNYGAPEAMFFTSQSEWKSSGMGSALRNFAAAMTLAISYSNQPRHQKEMLTDGLKASGERLSDLHLIPYAPFNATITQKTLTPILEAMVKVGWLPKAPNLKAFFN